jgi:hypothetical protein
VCAEVALLEVDASAHTVKESSYFRLQRRIEEEFMRSGVRRKGVIAVNGERQQDPKDRMAPLSETLVNACENFGYALITGESLFALVSYALEGADAEKMAANRQTILEADGLITIEEGDGEEEGGEGGESGDTTKANEPASEPDTEAVEEPAAIAAAKTETEVAPQVAAGGGGSNGSDGAETDAASADAQVDQAAGVAVEESEPA